jgi:outer membrane protein OmpA-like peptidoglycan-associated protein
MRKDPSIDAACVITPDMLGLCSGIDQTGSGAEGTLEGSHVVNSTATMSRSIADIYAVRSDYYKSNKAEVEKFFIGFCKATENIISWKTVYADGKGKSPEYMSALKMAQTIYGQAILPSLEVDAHGLVSDATFVRIPGNESFFSDPNNLTGFVPKQSNALDLAINLGYSKQKFGWDKAEWDYKAISDAVGVKYVAPVMATGRIKVEVTDFGADLDDSTIFSFEIKFEPEQTTFSTDTYAADFQRVAQQSQTFGNAVILIRGHSDPTLTLQNFFWAAKAKGLMTGESGNYQFNGKTLDLSNTGEVTSAIQSTNLSGQQRKNSSGQMVPIDDPRTTAAAALQLSQTRAFAVKSSIEQYAKAHGLTIDLSQIQPVGVGISEPINPRPRNIQQAKENMRVEFRVIRVKAESLSADDFNFEEE